MGRRPGGQTAGRDSEGLRKEAAVGIEYRSPHRVRVTQRRPIAGGAPRQPKERPSQTNAASLPPAERVVPLAGGTWCHSSPRSHWAHVSNKKSREREEPKEHPKVGPHDDQSALLACGQCWQAGGAGCGPEAGVVPSFLTNSAGGRRREGRPGQTTARAGSKQLEPTPPSATSPATTPEMATCMRTADQQRPCRYLPCPGGLGRPRCGCTRNASKADNHKETTTKKFGPWPPPVRVSAGRPAARLTAAVRVREVARNTPDTWSF